MVVFLFDGTLEGLLTAVFEYYETKPGPVQLQFQSNYQPGFLDTAIEIISDEAKARRVWTGLGKKLDKAWQQRFYKASLAETEAVFQQLFDFCLYIFDNPAGAENDFGHPAVMALTRIERSVDRERHRMKAFIRFAETADGIYYAGVEPDFNVLPLVVGFFRNRYADQPWIIYDLRRDYGVHYDLKSVQEVRLETFPQTVQPGQSGLMHEGEALYALLWKDYFKATNIPARRNLKLHLQHVPRRYWKYLTEKL